MRQHLHHSRGMTLIELLAATLILSAVAAAGVRILRDAGSSLATSSRASGAAEAMARWRIEAFVPYQQSLVPAAAGASAAAPQREALGAGEIPALPDWTWTDRSGRAWRIRLDTSATAGVGSDSDAAAVRAASAFATEDGIQVRWCRASVACRSSQSPGGADMGADGFEPFHQFSVPLSVAGIEKGVGAAPGREDAR